MVFRFGESNGQWIDLENPTADEVRDVARELGFGGRILDELISPSPLPVVLYEESAALLVLHFPSAAVLDGRPAEQEVDFVVGAHFVLTVRYEVVVPVHELRKLLEAGALIDGHARVGADALLELILNHLFGNIRLEGSHAGKRLERVEHDMFAGNEREAIRAISEISREFLHLEASIAAEEDPLKLFLDELMRKGVFGSSFKTRVERILGQHAQTGHTIATLRSIATELRESNMSLLTASQNEIMKTLTVISFIVLPLGLIANVFEMNVADVPFMRNPHAFWIVVGIMLCVSGIVALFVARKRWL